MLLRKLSFVVMLLLVGAACARPNSPSPAGQSAPTQNPASSAAGVGTAYAQTAPPAASSVDLASAIRQVSQQVRPAVVQITSLQQQVSPFIGATGASVPTGVGSGVIYDSQGH